jgi:uncharacterized protein YdaU (DUF1376 family)
MAKDPAFLFYTQDFTTGTQFLSDEQIGKYIRLLCAQHQHGHLSEKHMLHICKTYDKEVFDKFIKDDDGNYYNERLEHEVNRRKTYSESRRNNAKHPKKQRVKNSKAYAKHMPEHMENENINTIIKQLVERLNIEVPENEKKYTTMLVVKMFQAFLDENPDYFHHKETDYAACLQIAYHIAGMKKWSKHDVINGKMGDCLNSWQSIIQYIKDDKWFSGRSLSDLSSVKEWQRLTQQMSKHTTNGKSTTTKQSSSADGKFPQTDTL